MTSNPVQLAVTQQESGARAGKRYPCSAISVECDNVNAMSATRTMHVKMRRAYTSASHQHRKRETFPITAPSGPRRA